MATKSSDRTITFKKLKRIVKESRETLWWAVCVSNINTDPFDDHEYTLGYFGDFADAKNECIKDMNRYIRETLINGMHVDEKDIRQYRSLKNDCIVGVETKYDDDSRFWLIKPVSF